VQAIAEPVEFEAVNHQEKPFSVDLERLKLDVDTAKDLYRDMRLGRDFEDMCAQMYYRGKMFGFVHLYCGQEAVSTGVIRLLGKKDYVCRCASPCDGLAAFRRGRGARAGTAAATPGR
jgi:TPP-dependent pyruvate/acetoin dehydrogenase alpha subunit